MVDILLNMLKLSNTDIFLRGKVPSEIYGCFSLAVLGDPKAHATGDPLLGAVHNVIPGPEHDLANGNTNDFPAGWVPVAHPSTKDTF